ncbi:MAG: DUF3107 domain-containing protein [Acidimicrobiales bacterium]|nr:DUF3107 domain-containing protein [Acidimicrobiales bacterium]
MAAAPTGGDPVDVRIGLTQTPKELEVHLEDGADPADIRQQVESALADSSTLWFTDRRGRQVGVPAEKLAYVEIGSPQDERRIGFGG